MSILKSIFDKIFGSAAAQASFPNETISVAAPPPNTDSAPQAPVPPTSAGASAPIPPPTVDVAPILDRAVAAKGQRLNWRTSIVDLMKALDLESGPQARQQLAKELHYTGDPNDSAKMNVWLHSQLMKKARRKRRKGARRSEGLGLPSHNKGWLAISRWRTPSVPSR